MLAFTGLETVANLAEEARRPGVDLPRSVFGAIATVVTVYVAIAVVAVSAFPGPQTELGTTWIRAPLLGVAERLHHELPWGLGAALRFYVGITGALILLAAVTTSVSGFSRLAYSLGEHGQLPRSFGRLSRRAHVSPQADPRGRCHLVGDRGRDGVVQEGRRRVPREPLLVRRAARVHRGAAGGDQAADRRARPAAAVPGTVPGEDRAAARFRSPRSSVRPRRSRCG